LKKYKTDFMLSQVKLAARPIMVIAVTKFYRDEKMSISTPEVVQRATDRDLGIDIFWPEDDAKRSAVILLHGGGWSGGHRSEMHRYARQLRQRGFLAIAAEYRLTSEAPWPAQILEVKDVIRWVRDNAAWLRVDPDRIALQGFSSGGHLALLAAGTAGKSCFGADEPPAEVAAGTKTDLHFYHGHAHEFAALPSMLEPVQAEVALFLERAVVDPAFYTREALALNPFARMGLRPPERDDFMSSGSGLS
jgi:acetyl esterase/lipase